MSDVTLIVPTLAETASTGLRLAAEKKIYGVPWRVEFWRQNPYPQVFRRGVKVSIANVPEHAARFVNAVRRNHLDPMESKA